MFWRQACPSSIWMIHHGRCGRCHLNITLTENAVPRTMQQLALLRENWPVAFPAEPKSVRPLAIGATGEIASAMGWSLSYTLGVLARWKMAPVSQPSHYGLG
jgi:hypothetical protein